MTSFLDSDIYYLFLYNKNDYENNHLENNHLENNNDFILINKVNNNLLFYILLFWITTFITICYFSLFNNNKNIDKEFILIKECDIEKSI